MPVFSYHTLEPTIFLDKFLMQYYVVACYFKRQNSFISWLEKSTCSTSMLSTEICACVCYLIRTIFIKGYNSI